MPAYLISYQYMKFLFVLAVHSWKLAVVREYMILFTTVFETLFFC